MGALDKRIFSCVAIVSALLFVMSAVILLVNGNEVNIDNNRTVLYVVAASGILAIVYSVTLMKDCSSFVRVLSGILALITGVIFLAVPLVMDSASTLLTLASIAATVTIMADMLTLWVTRIYGAMYVAAVLAAVNIVMDVLYFIEPTQATYHAIAFLAFGIWLVLSIFVIRFINVRPATKIRERKRNQVFKKTEKPQTKDKKATKKTKKPPKKAQPRPAEKTSEVPKRKSKDELKLEEPKAENPAPAAAEERSKRPVKIVELPKRSAPPKEVPRAEEPKEGLKTAAANDFMKRLMSSQNANRAKQEIPMEEPKAEKPAPAAVEESKTKLEVLAEPILEPEQTVEVVDEPITKDEWQPVEESVVDEPVEVREIIPIEEPTAEPEPFEEAIEEPMTQEVKEESVEGVSAGELAESEPVTEVPTEETSVEKPIEANEKSKAIMEGSAEELEAAKEVPEPVTEDEEQFIEEAPEQIPLESEPVLEPVATGEVDIITSTFQESSEEELEEDIYTDYSPEAMVRRAAWNKGLRCRRGYGKHNIPVAFVKGKVAVYVDSIEADTSMDAKLAEKGWTILRYDAATITDGKTQGEEIAAVVKANMRSAKAAAKKKSKK